MPDVSAAIAPKSQQLDNIELRGKGPQIFTITAVDVRETLDQPLIVHLAEFPRPWKPGKTMGRVLAQCWGLDSDNWIGKQVELFADESIKFGNDTPGGTRISRVSDIDGPKSAAILLGQGKPGLYKVDPLPASPASGATPAAPEPTEAEVASCTDRDQLTAMWKRSGPDMRAVIEARVADLDNEPA